MRESTLFVDVDAAENFVRRALGDNVNVERELKLARALDFLEKEGGREITDFIDHNTDL